ncbi:protein kish-B isoform X1 [Phyllopteryx taeniolatus]|uniref:protein kish-B isoform X1 n=1 Tax=Phyllopteryx taeniolatus TaxID=161469 RepID=UPI002AD26C2D|nr:protein kish-B isoform X1 [Phyllopteryx taeniolatus]
MTNVYSFDGILVFGLLFICTCAYFKKVPRLNSWLLSEKKGVWGVFYKAAPPTHKPAKCDTSSPLILTQLREMARETFFVLLHAAVIGTRLHISVAISCVVMAFYLIFLK